MNAADDLGDTVLHAAVRSGNHRHVRPATSVADVY